MFIALNLCSDIIFLLIIIRRWQKKKSSEENERLNEINKSSLKFTEQTIKRLNTVFCPLENSISPLVDKLHVHLDVFPEKEMREKILANYGFISYNLCLNAETEQKHTECDASYTVISVPSQLHKKTHGRKWNKGRFELHINPNCTFIIPMDVGTSFTYSGYLLTHRQQIYRQSDDVPEFMNIVTYNSKRLFENMMQSFRRYLRND